MSYHDMTPDRRALVDDNLRLIPFTINKYFRPIAESEMEEAKQDGYFGLLRAAEKFDPERGIKFSSYACTWIRQAVQRGRGDREGIDYRRAAYAGNANDYSRPLSINALLSSEDDESEFADILPDENDGPDLLSVEVVVVRGVLQEAIRFLCNHPIDRPVLIEVVDAAINGRRTNWSRLAVEHGVSDSLVRKRHKELVTSLRERFPDLVAA